MVKTYIVWEVIVDLDSQRSVILHFRGERRGDLTLREEAAILRTSTTTPFDIDFNDDFTNNKNTASYSI